MFIKRFYGVISWVILIECSFILNALAAAPTQGMIQTKTKIRQLDVQINHLRHLLTTAHDKRGILNQELSGTEKQISTGIQNLRTIQHSIQDKHIKIEALQNTVNQLNQQLMAQQELLASHVRARYQMGEYQPLKWLLNQNDPQKISRILTYYQYIVLSRQELIGKINKTRTSLNTNKEKLHNEVIKNQYLKNQLTQHQYELEKNKTYHTTLIQTLDSEIQKKQHVLQDYEKDKLNLAQLLKSLSAQSILTNSISFAKMRKKLPLPVHTPNRSLKTMNQGVTFFADEGAVVTAVHPGKVVFSDWLRGYGLLLIIDHGQGFMTLYAHNQSLFKRKGEFVSQNEQIASVGHSGGIKQNGLYFEIRLKGKAISPLSWLS